LSGEDICKWAPREQLEEIAEVVKRFPRLVVLSDEIYEYLEYPPAEHASFGALPEMQERTLTINGFSKGFAMTGWRLGYLAGPTDYAKTCATIQSRTTSARCSISQRAAIAALEMGYKGGEVIQEMVDMYLERRDYVISRLMCIHSQRDLEFVFCDSQGDGWSRGVRAGRGVLCIS